MARGDDQAAAIAVGRRVAPHGSTFSVAAAGEEVRVEVVAQADGPGGIFGFLPPVRLHAEAVTVAEEES